MITFDHEKSSVSGSLGIPEERAHAITAIVLYEIFNQEKLVFELFSSPEEAPRNLTTKTGVLETIFDNKLVLTEQERIYATWEFCKMDSVLGNNSNEGKTLEKVMTFLFSTCRGDKEKFVTKFVEMRTK